MKSPMTVPVAISLLLHVGVIALLMVSVDFAAKPEAMPQQSAAPVVKATAVDKAAVQQQVDRIKAQQAAALAAERQRQAEVQRQLDEVKRKNKAEQERLAKLEEQKRQQQLEVKRAEEAAKQAKLKKQAEEQKAKQAAEQRAAEEKAQRAAEAKRKQAEEQARQAEEARKRKEAERLAAEKAEAERKAAAERKRQQEAARQAAEAELAAQMAAEQAQLDQLRQQKVMSEVDRYAVLIQQAIKRNLRSDPTTIGKECQVMLSLAPDGFVYNYSVLGGDSNLCRATEAAIKAAGNLPVSSDDEVYQQMKQINLRIALEK
ncbi:cell envelope integrity protein TolA [Ferrimonas senticii]|uniref:cell envelope integrity protein TolA n=1 Tax=Ferrimonas senticii TaxID=394566 RepID=UPI000409E6F3|nr:cell envelope integrity protein TolA [Ferrimonas senticii]